MRPVLLKWVALSCLILSLLGWLAIIFVAKVFPGGHPPLVAYVAIPVLLTLIPINLIGFIIGVRSGVTSSGRRNKVVNAISALGNVVFLLLGGYSLLGF